MKLCWDNLERLCFNNDKFFVFRADGTKRYLYYFESCAWCYDPFIGSKGNKFCSADCGRNNARKVRVDSLGNTDILKRCPQCSLLKNREGDYHKKGKYCKDCYRINYLKKSDPRNGRKFGIVGGKKKCSSCREWLDVSYFHKNRSQNDGLQRYCIKCKRIRDSVGHRIRLSIKNKNGLSWENLVGYTLKDLKSHLESMFKPGMTWDNYGYRGWHIDHVKPVSLFEFDSYEDEDFKRCWALENLQPLWAEENMRKGNKYEIL